MDVALAIENDTKYKFKSSSSPAVLPWLIYIFHMTSHTVIIYAWPLITFLLHKNIILVHE